MIASIRGRIISVSPRCVVDVGGVGFDLQIPEKDRERLSPDTRDTTFHTFLYVREDRLSLFGFLDRVDRDLFLRLLEVTGVGPRLAIGALSAHPAAAIVSAIRRGDAVFLRQLHGLGRKTAERVCIELGDKLDDFALAPEDDAPLAPAGSTRLRDEVVLALTSLGLTRVSAEKTLDKMNWTPDEKAKVEDIVREALRYAGGGA